MEERLTLDEAVKISLAMESALLGAQELQLESTLSNVLYHRKETARIKSSNFQQPKLICVHCGYKNHKSSECKFKNAICNSCGIHGHISPICKDRKKKKPAKSNASRQTEASNKSRSMNALDVTSSKSAEDDIMVNFNRVNINYANEASVLPIMLDLRINGKNHKLQLDTGAAVSIISFKFYKEFFSKSALLKTNIVLSTLREKIRPLGKINVEASFNNKVAKNLELIVIEDPAPCLIGLPWINELDILGQLACQSETPVLPISTASDFSKVKNIMDKFPKLFSNKLGKFTGCKIKLFLKEDVIPKFCKARPVPFAIKEAVEKELQKLQLQQVISPIQHSDWAAPIVVLHKKDNSLRICGDYKVGVNPALKVNQYPLPIIEDIFTQLNGGVIFSKLDLSQAYQQLLMDDSAQTILTINTHKGLFRVHRMPFGISPAPAIFQQKMDELLLGLKGVCCYLDDILVTGKSLEDHCVNLNSVLSRLEEAGITLNQQKCEFLKSQVEYLGHVIDGNGLHASPSKISGIVEASVPKDVPQLRSFLGLVGYYRKFLPNLSTVLTPLNILLQKDVKWSWTTEAEAAFEQIKKEITSTKVLTHFNPKLPISLACDASPTGVGAVISHIFPDSSEHPIAFASRSLTTAEKKYSQLDKEALGILFGVKKFHQFLYGRKFTLWTDHKPLTRILGPTTEIPTLAAARLQRWALTLSAYMYDIKFRCSKENANADALSRSPSTSIFEIHTEEDSDTPLLIAHLDSFPINDKMIAKETIKDPILSQVMKFVRDGWPLTPRLKELEPFRSREEELSLQDGCLLWGLRVIIPSTFRLLILQELHRHHTGMVRMKMVARSYLWWPNLDHDIEQIVKACSECAIHSNTPAKAPIHPWIWPTKPWDRIHIDYAGPFMGHNFLICVDAHSKWPEVIPMKTTTTEKTISALGSLLARYGLPSHVVSDNGTQFTSQSFTKFTKQHGMRHSFSSPYHPSSNGQAERFVQTFKRMMKKSDSKLPIPDKVNELLYAYRSTPHVTTHQTPAFLFLGREFRTRMDLLCPSVQRVVTNSQDKMLRSRKDADCTKTFSLGQKVIARDYLSSNKWSMGIICHQLGPLTYQIRLPEGQIWKRHVDQIKDASLLDSFKELDVSAESADITLSSQTEQGTPTIPDEDTSVRTTSSPPRRTSNRYRRPPSKFLNPG